MPEKSKADRLKETIRLLKELERIGYSDAVLGYSEIKGVLTQWVNDGENVYVEIAIPKFNRLAKVSLPKMDDKAASILLKVVE
jgi:hypothetical protein